jgi:hypothetical protein
MNEFDDGYLDDYPEDDDYDDMRVVEDIDSLHSWLLQSASVNADLVLAGFRPDNPEKMLLWEMGMMQPYDPTYDYQFISQEELESIVSKYITYVDELPCMSSTDAMKCSEDIAVRIVSTTYELAAKKGLVEPVVTPDGQFTYVAKEGIDI